MLIKLSNYFLLLVVSLLTLSFSVKAQISPPTTLTCDKGYELDTVYDFELEPVTVYDYDPVEHRNIPRTELQKVRKLRWKCVPVTSEPKSAKSTTPKGKIQKIWVDYNVIEDKKKGMLIHSAFDVSNLKSKKCSANAYFYFASKKSINAESLLSEIESEAQGKRRVSNTQLYAIADEPLKDFNSKFSTANGNVAMHEDFTPTYENSSYQDFQLFMPDDELHMGTGEYNLKFVLNLSCEGLGFLAESEEYKFSYSRTK